VPFPESAAVQAADLSGILSDYATHLAQSRRFGAQACAAYLKAARELAETVRAMPDALLLPARSGLDAVDRRALEIYLRYLQTSRGWRPATLAAHLGALRAFFAYLVRAGYLEHNPARGLRIETPRRAPPLPEGEEERVRSLLASGGTGLAGARLRLLAELIYGGGQRPAHVFALQGLELRPAKGAIRLLRRGGEAQLPASPDGLRRARSYLRERASVLRNLGSGEEAAFWISARGRALSPAALARQLQQAMARAGLEGGPGELRRLAARHFRERGADLRSVREFLGARRLTGLEGMPAGDWRAVAEAFRKVHPRQGRG
jgi:site-specific recombinase XerC